MIQNPSHSPLPFDHLRHSGGTTTRGGDDYSRFLSVQDDPSQVNDGGRWVNCSPTGTLISGDKCDPRTLILSDAVMSYPGATRALGRPALRRSGTSFDVVPSTSLSGRTYPTLDDPARAVVGGEKGDVLCLPRRYTDTRDTTDLIKEGKGVMTLEREMILYGNFTFTETLDPSSKLLREGGVQILIVTPGVLVGVSR